MHGERDQALTPRSSGVFPDRNILTVGAERFHCAGVSAGGFYEISLQTSGSVTPTPAKSCTPMSCVRWQDRVPRYCWAHDEGTDGGGSFHDEIKARVFRPFMHLFVSLSDVVFARHSGTQEGGTQLGRFRSRPLELGGVASNPSHLTTCAVQLRSRCHWFSRILHDFIPSGARVCIGVPRHFLIA